MVELFDKSDAFGTGSSSSILVDADGVRLPNQPARYLILSNWNVQNDPAMTIKGGAGSLLEELGEEVYWGFNGVYAHQLFPSQTTGLIPVNNLQQICLRTRTGDSITVWYSWIR